MKTSHKIGGGSAAMIAIACAFIQPWEGLWLTAKVDRIGTGMPPTVCYGETEGVKVGQKFTPQQCSDMLAKSLPKYWDGIAPCIHVDLPDKVKASLISGAYNAGEHAMCKSPMIARMNAGHLREGCEAFRSWYIRAQGRVVKGLINRRNGEAKLCLEGVNDPVVTPKPAPKVTPQSKPAPIGIWEKLRLYVRSIFKGN